jgi:hypothetical protein
MDAGSFVFQAQTSPPLACISFKLFKPLLWLVSHHQTLNLIKTGASKLIPKALALIKTHIESLPAVKIF